MIGNWSVVTPYQPWEIVLSFVYDFQRHMQEMTQVKLALQNKLNLSSVCMTKLFLSAQGLKAGVCDSNSSKAKTLAALPWILQSTIIISSSDTNRKYIHKTVTICVCMFMYLKLLLVTVFTVA